MNKFLNKPIAIIGAGSIGERYIRILNELGFKNIFVLRRSIRPFNNIGLAQVKVVTTFNDLLSEQIFCAIIATPTNLHLEQAILLTKNGIHVLVEKPLSNTLEFLDTLKKIVREKNIYVLVGYMMRFHPLILDVKTNRYNQDFGKLISIQSKWAEFLPDWHPWEDYRTSYAANKHMGGGVALTLSHDIDLALFLAQSKVSEFSVYKNYSPKLNIDVDSSADIIIKFENDIIANIHLNFFEEVKERFTKLSYENGSILFDYFNNKLVIKTKEFHLDKTLQYFQRDSLFKSQLIYFFEILSSNINYSSLSIENINTSEVIIKICNDGK